MHKHVILHENAKIENAIKTKFAVIAKAEKNNKR